MVRYSGRTGIMSRFFVDPGNVGEKNIYITDRDDLHHIKKVLRLRPGDEVEISDGEKWEYSGVIEDISDTEAAVRITDRQAFAREPEIRVTLFQGVPKSGKMDFIVQKCVELGVSRIVPVFLKRCDVKDNDRTGKKAARWQKIADEACKQCRRGMIPEVEVPVSGDEMYRRLDDFDLVLFPYENEEKTTMRDCLCALKEKPRNVAVIIGPEGGFSDGEAEYLKRYECVSLGKTVLRTETAGMAALAMIMYQLEL